MSMDKSEGRTKQFHAKALAKQQAERTAELDKLAARPDYRRELAYFLELFRGDLSLSAVAQRVGRPVAAVLCVHAPLELFHAFGVHPFKVFSGSHAAGQAAAPHLPPLTCPVLRSVLGALQWESPPNCSWIVPTSCDWVVKIPEMARLSGALADRSIYWMELPRLKNSQRAGARWYSEVVALSDFLAQSVGRKGSSKALSESIEIFKAARQSLNRLIALRRAGMVPALWFFLIANAFFLDSVENWTAALEKALPGFKQSALTGGRIFLAGSPIFFPNFKLLHLLEKAGLVVTGDDLCSSERIFPVNIAVNDPSREGLLNALAESYHQGCLCPTFGDSEHRINNIREALPDADFLGLVFHVLKGCHPFDLESFVMEAPLKEAGLRFLRVESDYGTEDVQNLLTRLEAFRKTLGDRVP